MATTIQDLEERVDALYNSVLQLQQNLNPVTDRADSAYNKVPQVDANTEGVSDNDLAICDVADLADTNSMAIDDLAAIHKSSCPAWHGLHSRPRRHF